MCLYNKKMYDFFHIPFIFLLRLRFCQLLSDFYCLSACYESTDDNNGLSSSSLANTRRTEDQKSTHISSSPHFEDETTGWLPKNYLTVSLKCNVKAQM